MSQKIKNLTKEIGILTTGFTLALVIFIGLSIANAWLEPGQAPPNGNLAAPINVGGTLQDKSGSFSVSGAFLDVANNFYVENGSVGIGTTFPTQKLDVAGAIKGNQFCIGTNCISAWPVGGGGGIAGSGTANYMTKWTGANSIGNSIVTENGTNVGIGIASPTYKLDVGGPVRVTTTTPLIRYNNGTDRGWTGWEGGFGGMTMYNDNGGGQIVIKDGTGNVGIGTSTSVAGQKLNVLGSAYIQGVLTTTGGISDLGDTLLGGSKTYVANKLGIGTISPTQKLDVAGTAKATQVNAGQYCDINGANCKVIASMGGMSSSYQSMSNGGCRIANSFTGGCSCPGGTTARLMFQAYLHGFWDSIYENMYGCF